jgi:hypothetical protein
MTRRLAHHHRYQGLVVDGDWSGEVRWHPEMLEEPLRWGKPQMVFVCSMSDLFHPAVPWGFIMDVFIVMERTPQHTYQVLTKRPGRMAYFAEHVWPDYIRPADARQWPLSDGVAQLVCSDPPYNVGMPYDRHDDSLPWQGYFDLLAAMTLEARRVLRSGGVLAVMLPTHVYRKVSTGHRGHNRNRLERRRVGPRVRIASRFKE